MWVRSLGQEDYPGEGNDNPLQNSCLENPMDKGSWRATVHGVVKSHTWLKWLSMHACTQESSITSPVWEQPLESDLPSSWRRWSLHVESPSIFHRRLRNYPEEEDWDLILNQEEGRFLDWSHLSGSCWHDWVCLVTLGRSSLEPQE